MSLPSIGLHNARKLSETSRRLRAPKNLSDVKLALEDGGNSEDDDGRLLKALSLLQSLSRQNVEDEPKSHEITQLAYLIGHRYLSKLRSQDLSQGKPKPDRQCHLTNINSGSNQDNRAAMTAELALACLHSLAFVQSFSLDEETLFRVIAYTDPGDPWTTREAASLAKTLIDVCLSEDQLRPSIIDFILPRRLRPLFSGTTNKVSHSGRPLRNPERARHNAQASGDTPPWKNDGLQIVSAVRWVVQNADQTLIRDNWPLFTPVLLTISDDQDTAVRTAGLEITANFLEKCPAEVLTSTGIGDVFQDTILPSVLYLPSLTPAEESVRIMGAAYEALQVLVEKEPDVRYPTRRALLDRIFRDGVFPAYEHASDHPTVVETLMRTAAMLLDKLSIFAAKHLPNLLSMISSVLTDPFAVLYPGLIAQTTTALNSLIANCWPRVAQGEYADEVTRLISICWLNVTDEASPARSHSAHVDVRQLERGFKQTGAMLRSLREGSGTREPDGIQAVVAKEPRISNILSSP